MKLYGLKACDTCRKARQAIEKQEKEVEFIDVRETPLTATLIAEFAEKFGEALVNKRSTTWRDLSESERNLGIEPLIARHPTVMKRPVIEENGELTLGWSPEVQARHLGTARKEA